MSGGGLFIALEGGEGSGKSTQASHLAHALRTEYGRKVLVTREPGGTVTGQKLRELLLADEVHLTARAEALLYAADRALHMERVVEPALAAGMVVISDRHAGSSIAYQGAGRGLGERRISELAMFATEHRHPHLTVLLDVAPEIGLARARERGETNRFEAEELAFHRAVRASFLRQAGEGAHRQAASRRWAVVPAAYPEDQVAEKVLRVVVRRLRLVETESVDAAA
ncbi:dTMP kinase [Actinoplanes sp. URMC 104]|uniref:dTMP kinase n=1 Tax=Actinoplanes sp. URMC 104 TaxID=3423409 RepID=UPI003F1B7295